MRGIYRTRGFSRGYTVIEVSVIIIVLAILAAIMVDSAVGYQVRARDSERTADVDVITRSLERYYRTQAVATGASYPPSSVTPSQFGAYIEDIDATFAPGLDENSIVIATSNAAQTPSVSQYIYQPLQVNGALCTSSPCPRYKMYYLLEVSEQIIVKDSLRQQ